MKHELELATPAALTEAWPGQFALFSWLNFAVSIPGPIFIITTRKESGLANACLHAWGMFAGETGNYTCLMAVPDYTHTKANILREREWCVNFPSFAQYQASFKTVGSHGPEQDELLQAGFTTEEGVAVGAPRIAECHTVLECRLTWDRPLQDGSNWHLFAGRVVHAAVDAAVATCDTAARMRAMDLMYSFNEPLDPSTFARAWGGVGMLQRFVNVHRADGTLKTPAELNSI